MYKFMYFKTRLYSIGASYCKRGYVKIKTLQSLALYFSLFSLNETIVWKGSGIIFKNLSILILIQFLCNFVEQKLLVSYVAKSDIRMHF